MNAKKEQKVRKQIDEILNKNITIDGESVEFDFEILVTEWEIVPGSLGVIAFDGLVYEIINGYHGYGSLYEKIDNIFTEWAKGVTKNPDAYYDFIDYSNIEAFI